MAHVGLKRGLFTQYSVGSLLFVCKNKHFRFMKIVGKVEDDKDRVGQQNYKTVA